MIQKFWVYRQISKLASRAFVYINAKIPVQLSRLHRYFSRWGSPQSPWRSVSWDTGLRILYECFHFRFSWKHWKIGHYGLIRLYFLDVCSCKNVSINIKDTVYINSRFIFQYNLLFVIVNLPNSAGNWPVWAAGFFLVWHKVSKCNQR